VLQFVCECDVVKDTGKEEYLRPFIHIGLDLNIQIIYDSSKSYRAKIKCLQHTVKEVTFPRSISTNCKQLQNYKFYNLPHTASHKTTAIISTDNSR